MHGFPEDLRVIAEMVGCVFDPERIGVRMPGDRLDPITEAWVAIPTLLAVEDIYGAQRSYLRQNRTTESPPDFGRTPLVCLCSDARCRALQPAPTIAARAYREAPREGDYTQSPHFGWNAKQWHHLGCMWVLREIAARTADRGLLEPGEAEEEELERLDDAENRRPRRTDHVDEFRLRQDAQPDDNIEAQFDYGFVGNDGPRNLLRRIRKRLRVEANHPNTTTLMRSVVASYDRLVEQRRAETEALTIDGVTRTFRDWFRAIGRYDRTFGPKTMIWNGGATVEEAQGGFTLQFYDRVQAGRAEAVQPRIDLSHAILEQHSRGPILREALAEALLTDRGYVKIYWYGELTFAEHGLAPDVGANLERLHIAVRAAEAARHADQP